MSGYHEPDQDQPADFLEQWLDYADTMRKREKEDGPDEPAKPDPEDSWRGVYPGMCVDPEICRGKTACPRNYSCCE